MFDCILCFDRCHAAEFSVFIVPFQLFVSHDCIFSYIVVIFLIFILIFAMQQQQQPYDTSTYYSGMFRMAPEADARYSAFLPSATNVKLNGGSRPAPTIQNASSQEVN